MSVRATTFYNVYYNIMKARLSPSELKFVKFQLDHNRKSAVSYLFALLDPIK